MKNKENGFRRQNPQVETEKIREKTDYPCSNCDLRLETESLLKAHWQTHNEHRSYECNECDKTFVRNDQLTRHIQI